jgi:hypothetical protein
MPWRRIGEWRYSSTHSLTSALDGGEWSASRPGLFTPRERAPGTHWIGGWVDPRAVLDAVVKRKITNPRRESNPENPDRPARSSALYRLSCCICCQVLQAVWSNHSIVTSVCRVFPSEFPIKTFVCISYVLHACCLFDPSYTPRLYHHSSVWWRLKIT